MQGHWKVSTKEKPSVAYHGKQKRTLVSLTYAKELIIPMYNITDSKLVTKKKKKKKIAIQYVGRAGSALADYGSLEREEGVPPLLI